MNEANYQAYKKILTNYRNIANRNYQTYHQIRYKKEAEIILEAKFKAELDSFNTALHFLNSAHENEFGGNG